jgi:hypothetical protein
MPELDDLISFDVEPPSEIEEPPTKIVVRLTTSYWYGPDGLNMKQTLRFMRRQCTGYNFLYEDCSMIGAHEVMPRIVNLNECKDGLYEVVTCNEHGSWETPHIIEDYDYRLIPLK